MRKLLLLVASVVFVSSASLSGCTMAEGSDDEEFDRDWKDDYESDSDEDAAEGAETEELDALDDLDDIEEPGGSPIFDGTEATTDPEGGAGPGEEPLPDGLEGAYEGGWEGEGEGEGSGEPGRPGGGSGPIKKPPPRKHGPLSIMEDDPHFSGPASDERLDRAKELGIDAIRVMLWWKDKVPGDPNSTTKPKDFVSSKPDAYNWTKLDTQIEGARARGLKVMLTIPAGPMPYWASEEPEYCVKQGGWTCAWKPQYKEYAKWVAAVGRHVKDKGYRIWAWSFVNEPNITAFLKDETSLKTAHRYRKLWFHARKALRATAGVKARVFFSDQANNAHELDPSAARWKLFNQALCLNLEKDAELIKGFCPLKARKVQAHGIAFHPYAANPLAQKQTVYFLQKLVDEAAREKRLPRNRGLYMTENAFLTARGSDAGKLGAAGLTVTPNQQASYMNKGERLLARNPRVKSLAQYELVDEGRGTWDCGLIYANGYVKTKGGETVTGDFHQIKLGSHITVGDRTIGWNDIADKEGGKEFWSTGPGGEKPAYAAYRISIDVVKTGDKVEVWGLARNDTGAGFTIEGLFPSGEWQELKTVKTDVLGFGRAVIPRGNATAWRIRFGGDVSRIAR